MTCFGNGAQIRHLCNVIEIWIKTRMASTQHYDHEFTPFDDYQAKNAYLPANKRLA